MKKIILSFLVTFLFMFSAFSQTNALESSVERGYEIYKDFCINCHLPTGEGVAGVFPPLAKSDYLVKNRIESIRAIKFGLQGEIVVNGKTYNSVMAPLGLSDDEVADVMNYINKSWGNTNDKIVTEDEVSKIEKQ